MRNKTIRLCNVDKQMRFSITAPDMCTLHNSKALPEASFNALSFGIERTKTPSREEKNEWTNEQTNQRSEGADIAFERWKDR